MGAPVQMILTRHHLPKTSALANWGILFWQRDVWQFLLNRTDLETSNYSVPLKNRKSLFKYFCVWRESQACVSWTVEFRSWGLGWRGDPGSCSLWGWFCFLFLVSKQCQAQDCWCFVQTTHRHWPQRLGETSVLHVGTKGAQKFSLIQLKAMKSPHFSPGFIK